MRRANRLVRDLKGAGDATHKIFLGHQEDR